MRTATIYEIKDQLTSFSKADLVSLCVQLARNKKENKEFIAFRLFESGDLRSFTEDVKAEIRSLMDEVHRTNMHAAKKTIRKILRVTNKYIRFAGSRPLEAELRLEFCTSLSKSGIPIHKSAVLQNMIHLQIRKIRLAIASLHEDLQHDFNRHLESLNLP
jgi:hypothetical protein